LPSERDEEMGSKPLLVWRDVPDSEKDRVLTIELTSSACSSKPEPASHILTVLSTEDDASVLLSQEKATVIILSEWPLSVCSSVPELVSHRLSVLGGGGLVNPALTPAPCCLEPRVNGHKASAASLLIRRPTA
jgi:hypothetical protein